MNPLVKLLRKLTPVSTEITTTTRVLFKPPSSSSKASIEPLETFASTVGIKFVDLEDT